MANTIKKTTTSSFSLTLRLNTSDNDIKILEKRFDIARHLYNVCVKEARRRVNSLKKDKEYKRLMKIFAINKKFSSEEKEILRHLRVKYDLEGKYSLEKYLNRCRKKFRKYIDADTCCSIAQTAWKAVDSYLYKNGKKIHFKNDYGFDSVSSKTNKQGIIFRENAIKWLDLKIPVFIRNNDNYAKKCLLEHRIKLCRIKRKWYKHNYRYYAELVLEGKPPLKNRHSSNGEVGIDIGTSTIAAVSRYGVLFKELGEEAQYISKEISRLNRKSDRQRRANNPQNYNKNGTIRKNTKNFKRKWYYSKKHRLTLDRIRYLYRLRTDLIKQSHNRLANQILTMGDCIYIEDLNFEAMKRKSKELKKSKKTGRLVRRKRYGKTIREHCPGTLVLKLAERAKLLDCSFNKVNTNISKASKLNHITQEYVSSDINSRWKTIDKNIKVQRDLYSAFLLSNSDASSIIDTKKCENNFMFFYYYHNAIIKEMQRLKYNGKYYPSSMGIRI